MNLSEKEEAMNAMNAKTVEIAKFECANSITKSINKYDTNREDSISVRIVLSALNAHTARMRRLQMLLCVAMRTWSAQTT